MLREYKGCKYHHAATAAGYVSRRGGGYYTSYSGRYGTGYIYHIPRYDTTRYHYIIYYVKGC